MNDNKRSEKRRSLIYYLKVADLVNDDMVGHLCDISVKGMLLLGESPLVKGEIYDLQINVPERLSSDESFTVKAECRWSQRDLNPRFYVSGFLFHDVNKTSNYKINRLIEELAFAD